MTAEPLHLAIAIIAVTRKHMNLETIWTEEMTLLTTRKLSHFRDIFAFIDQRYAQNFPDSVSYQAKVVQRRQKLERVISLPNMETKQKSEEMSSSAKVCGSATTQVNTHSLGSGASQKTGKYVTTLSSQKAFYDCLKGSSVKKFPEKHPQTLQQTAEKVIEPFSCNQENNNLTANIESHLNHLISVNTSISKQVQPLKPPYVQQGKVVGKAVTNHAQTMNRVDSQKSISVKNDLKSQRQTNNDSKQQLHILQNKIVQMQREN